MAHQGFAVDTYMTVDQTKQSFLPVGLVVFQMLTSSFLHDIPRNITLLDDNIPSESSLSWWVSSISCSASSIVGRPSLVVSSSSLLSEDSTSSLSP